MPDQLLLNTNTLEDFEKTARALDFEAILAWGMPVYVDVARRTGMASLEKSLEAIKELKNRDTT